MNLDSPCFLSHSPSTTALIGPILSAAPSVSAATRASTPTARPDLACDLQPSLQTGLTHFDPSTDGGCVLQSGISRSTLPATCASGFPSILHPRLRPFTYSCFTSQILFQKCVELIGNHWKRSESIGNRGCWLWRRASCRPGRTRVRPAASEHSSAPGNSTV